MYEWLQQVLGSLLILGAPPLGAIVVALIVAVVIAALVLLVVSLWLPIAIPVVVRTPFWSRSHRASRPRASGSWARAPSARGRLSRA